VETAGNRHGLGHATLLGLWGAALDAAEASDAQDLAYVLEAVPLLRGGLEPGLPEGAVSLEDVSRLCDAARSESLVHEAFLIRERRLTRICNAILNAPPCIAGLALFYFRNPVHIW
jgi:hypothetical protein